MGELTNSWERRYGGTEVLTNPTPPEGFRWQVVGPDVKTIKSGTAETQAEARTAGNKAASAIKAKG